MREDYSGLFSAKFRKYRDTNPGNPVMEIR